MVNTRSGIEKLLVETAGDPVGPSVQPHDIVALAQKAGDLGQIPHDTVVRSGPVKRQPLGGAIE